MEIASALDPIAPDIHINLSIQPHDRGQLMRKPTQWDIRIKDARYKNWRQTQGGIDQHSMLELSTLLEAEKV